MSIKEKIKSIIGKRGKVAARRKSRTDSELGADEVLREEVFPEKTAKKSPSKPAAKKSCTRSKCSCAAKTDAAKKPASKRTRPTIDGYKMIDPSGDTFDANKS